MQNIIPPLEQCKNAQGYYAETNEEFSELKNKKSRADFEIQSPILTDTSESSGQPALQVRGDYFEQEILSGSYTIYLYQKGKILGSFKYQGSDGERVKLRGNHFTKGKKLIIFLEELTATNIVLYSYFVTLEISTKTIEHFRDTIFIYSDYLKHAGKSLRIFEPANSAFQILNHATDYAKGKNLISNFFISDEGNSKEKIFFRLTLIDAFYSTQMNKRLFGIDDLVEGIHKLAKTDKELKQMAEAFIVKPSENQLFKLITADYGIHKNGEAFGKASSLITKYLYFLTNYNFPIFDGLVKSIYPKIKKVHFKKDLPGIGIECDMNFFLGMKKLNEISGISNFDKLDNLLWLAGKIENNSYQLILNQDKYKIYLKVIKRIRATEKLEFIKSLRRSKSFSEIFHPEMSAIFDFIIELHK